MGWRSLKKSALDVSARHRICGHGFYNLHYLLSLAQVSWCRAEPGSLCETSSQSLRVLASGLLSSELQPWKQGLGEAACLVVFDAVFNSC